MVSTPKSLEIRMVEKKEMISPKILKIKLMPEEEIIFLKLSFRAIMELYLQNYFLILKKYW